MHNKSKCIHSIERYPSKIISISPSYLLLFCIASSNVPFITGSIFQKYRNTFSYDGIFSKCPYLTKKPALHIHPNMWGQNKCLLNYLKRIVLI